MVHPAVWPQYTWTEKWAGVLCPFQGELGLRLRQCGLGWGLPPTYKVAFRSI